jgi:uncharacterized protein (TIGR03067 family)
MRTRWLIALGGLSLPLATALAAQSAGAGTLLTDSARLQGTWSMVSGAADGFPLPPSYVKDMRRVFAGNEVTVTMGGSLFLRASIVLDPTATPKRIDYHMTGGPTAGATQLGIYQITGDTVQFCFGSPNAPRPADFTSAAGDGRTLSKWVRGKP